MRNKRVIICSAVLILIMGGAGIFITRNSADTPDRLISLGEKYLTELNYEQALVQFLKVIEIDPVNPRGYTGAAEAYIGLGQTEDAIEILRQGLDRTDDDTIRGMLARLELEWAELNGTEQESGTTEDAVASNPNPQDIVKDAMYTMPEIPYTLDRLNVPYINLVSDDARQVNEQLHSYFEDVALFGDPNPGEYDSEHGPWYTDIDYTYYVNGDMLSIIVIKASGGTAPPIYEVATYNLNIKSGKSLSYSDLAAYARIEEKAVFDSFAEFATQKIYDEYRDYESYDMMQRDIAATYGTNKAWYDAKQMPWFLNKDGKLSSFVYLSLGLVGSGDGLICYTIDGQSIALAAGLISFDEGMSDAWKPTDKLNKQFTVLGSWIGEASVDGSPTKIVFNDTSYTFIDVDGETESGRYTHDLNSSVLTLATQDLSGNETDVVGYIKTVDESSFKLYIDYDDDWINSGIAYPFEFYYFTPSGMAFDADDFIMFTRTEDIELPAVAVSSPLLDKLCDGYWINDGFRFSDTEVYRFERGTKDLDADRINGIYYWDYYNEGKGSWRESEKYILNGDILTIYMGSDIADTLDYDANSGQFISRVKKQMVEQERMEDGVYIPAKTQPYSLSSRADDPRW